MEFKKSYFLFSLCIITNLLFSQNHLLNFDGTSDYLELNSVAIPLAGETSFTVEFWMKANVLNQTSSVRTSLFTINNMTNNGNRFLMFVGGATSQDGKLVIEDEGSVAGSNIDFISTQVIADNQCHHIAYVRDGSIGTIYIDGVNEGSFTSNFTLASDDLYSIGQEWDNQHTGSPLTSQFYNGDIDEFRIWTEVRTQGEIQANMNNELTGNEANLLVYYNFNQGISGGNNIGITQVTDNSLNSNDGNLNDFNLNGATSNFIAGECNIITTTVSNEFFMEDEIVIFPNPNNGKFNILLENNNNVRIEVYNINGQQIMVDNINISMSIDITNFPSGIYFVKIIIDNKKVIIKKVSYH